MLCKQTNRALITLSIGIMLTMGVVACTQNIALQSTSPLQVNSSDLATTGEAATANEELTEETTDAATEITNQTTTVALDAEGRPVGWGIESHSNDVDPNYEVVFADNKVNEITITVAPETWTAMQANMTELFGEFGRVDGPGRGTPPEGFQPPATGELPEGFDPPPNGAGRGGPGFGRDILETENPIWVTATVEFEGETWPHVGLRYKGNSSLRSSWGNGTIKLPFKLDFDQFEDDYPEINNQRFYGFKKLSFGNNFSDSSFMRETITYEMLEEAGLVASQTSFYEVTIDYGEGPVHMGLYTVVEETDDTVINQYFGDDKGNIYKPEGQAATLAEGTFDQIAEDFQKENNEDEADWSDIEALYTTLHSDQRTTDPEAWRAELESLFDVNTFIKWLALSAVIEHWDTYGAMSHNFYLYNDPETERLTWISWDHNMTMSTAGSGMRGGGGDNTVGSMPGMPGAEQATGEQAPAVQVRVPNGGRGMRISSLDKADVGNDWPLIRFLMDDPTYYERYLSDMQEVVETVFVPEKLIEKYQSWDDLLAPYAAEEMKEETYTTAVQELIDYSSTRFEAVKSFLGEQE